MFHFLYEVIQSNSLSKQSDLILWKFISTHKINVKHCSYYKPIKSQTYSFIDFFTRNNLSMEENRDTCYQHYMLPVGRDWWGHKAPDPPPFLGMIFLQIFFSRNGIPLFSCVPSCHILLLDLPRNALSFLLIE